MKHNGRPLAPKPQPLLWTHEELERYFDNTFFLTIVFSQCSYPLVPLLADALEAVKQQLVSECQRVLTIREEKKQFVAAYNRYVALQKELQDRSVKIDELVGMLGPIGTEIAIKEDASDAIGETLEVHMDIQQLRDELPLWKAIRWYLEYAGEARINEVLIFLGDLRKKWESRSAVESALRLHPEIFQVRKVKREKYISLKKGA